MPTLEKALVDDVEGHHLVGVGEVDVVLRRAVAQHDAGPGRVLREVDDHLVALGDTVPEAPHRDRCRDQPGVGGDDGHRPEVAQGPVVGPRHRGVEDPEPVLAARHLHHRPRHPVDGDDVAVEALLVVVVEQQAAVGVEHPVAHDEGDVVRTVGDGQRPFELVPHLVLPGEAHVDVLGGVVEPVVVVPEGARRLPVRVLVVLVGARVGDVAGVAVVLREGRGPVQVDRRPGGVAQLRVDRRQVVDLSHHGPAAAHHLERRARDLSVVTPHRSPEARDHLDQGGLHGHPEVVRGGVGPHRRDRPRYRERQGEGRRQRALGDPVGEDQRPRHRAVQGQRHRGASHDRQLHDVPT